MIAHFICLVVLVTAASSACFDNGDKEIGGNCYKLVNQKLSFENARNWCHSNGAFLTYVPNSQTASFLASYARAAFGSNNGNFWIGLWRKSSSSPWQWDNGVPVGWVNFDNIGGNYAAESMVNAKWNTQDDDAILPFVCSYDPGAPPTFPPVTAGPTTTPVFTSEPIPTSSAPPKCSPSDPFTFLFAYSNDVDKQTMDSTLDYIQTYLSPSNADQKISRLAHVRLDLQTPESVIFNDNFNGFISSIKSHYPDASLGYKDASTGTDAINIVKNYVQAHPDCGTKILLLIKRNTVEQDISGVVRLLQNNYFTVFISASDQLIGGSTSQTLYELSTRTNGVCAFSYNIAWMASNFIYLIPYYPSQSFNVRVHGQGVKQLPDMLFPIDGYAYQPYITVQGHPLTNDYFNATYTIENVKTFNITNPNLDSRSGVSGTLYGSGWIGSDHQNASSWLSYNYPTTTETLQIRWISEFPTTTEWPPYDNDF